ncbi:hypothetical protein BDN72DRAFT_488394 [Pluteus cervinus]|uniref:Uncharacterized protein n=1 Tax=Pluteus cervinus TaxID=181527 RepID=A0ACD3AZI7_9AGAR|nr:hypothetical protein BDN72DRAFT_488394 [Pluteus cervinus]
MSCLDSDRVGGDLTTLVTLTPGLTGEKKPLAIWPPPNDGDPRRHKHLPCPTCCPMTVSDLFRPEATVHPPPVVIDGAPSPPPDAV